MAYDLSIYRLRGPLCRSPGDTEQCDIGAVRHRRRDGTVSLHRDPQRLGHYYLYDLHKSTVGEREPGVEVLAARQSEERDFHFLFKFTSL